MDIPLASTTSKSSSELTSNIEASTSGTGNNNNIRILEDMFVRVLSVPDVRIHKKLVIPKKDAEMYFTLDSPNGKILSFQERNGKICRFHYSDSIKGYVMKGWKQFVREKKLRGGDTISFQRELGDKSETQRLYMDWRHRDSGKSGSGSTIGTVVGTKNPNLEWNAFNSFLKTRGLSLSGCRATDIIDFLSKQKNKGDPNALVCRLSAACESCGIKPKDNPFRSLAVIRYLQLLRRISRETPWIVFTCVDYAYPYTDEKLFIHRILQALGKKNITLLRCNLSLEKLDVKMCYTVGIMLLSNSFASNSHSLDHLVTIMERWKAKDLVLIPVYCDLTLSDILDGKFEPVQQQYLNYFQAEKVPKWKTAIAELASIDGHQIDRNGDVYQLSNAVSLACSRIYLKTTDNLVRILALLDQPQPPDAAEFEGIWGMPGIGKTAIAREIFEILSPQYDLCYFVQDFHLISQRKGLRQIHDDFFSELFGEEKPSIGFSDTKSSFLREWFHNKSLLIIIDDVSNARDAEYVVGGFDWFSRGHKIILTSRRKQVLVQCKVKNPYKMQKLNEFETTRLFNACYMKGNEVDFPLVSVMNLSSGIPLAVKVMGKTDVWSYWNFDKLRMHPRTEIEKAFRSSFDGLDDNEKNIFLDLACFFRGENKDHVVQVLDACGFLTELGICDLIDESLISLVDNRIEIPIPFQQFGRFIVRDEDKDPCRHSRLWDTNAIKDVLTNNSATEAIEGIFLDASDENLELSPTVFGKMNRLRLLKFYCSTFGDQCNLSLTQGLNTLPDELRLLHWERCPLKNLPQEFNPENLVELNMPYSSMEKLWEAKKNLQKLKKINLSHSRNLSDIQMLSEALNVEHIDLEGCTSLVDVSTSIPHRGKLISLNMKECSHLKSLPAMCELTSLKLLNLSGCTEVKEIQDFAPNLEELYLAGTAISQLPLSVVNLTELVMLDLENCERLQQLPPRIRNSRPNSKLKLSGCTSLGLWKRKNVGKDLFSVQEKGKSRKEENQENTNKPKKRNQTETCFEKKVDVFRKSEAMVSANVIYLSAILSPNCDEPIHGHKCNWKCDNEHVCGNMYRCKLTGLTHICDKNCNQRILYDNHSSLCRVSGQIFPLTPVEEQAVKGVRRKLDAESHPSESCSFKHHCRDYHEEEKEEKAQTQKVKEDWMVIKEEYM